MPNFDSGSTMSYPLALRININKKQTNKQTNRTSVLCLPWCWLALPSFLGPIANHFIPYHYYSKPITLSSWLSFFRASNQISRLDFSDTFSVFIFSFSFILWYFYTLPRYAICTQSPTYAFSRYLFQGFSEVRVPESTIAIVRTILIICLFITSQQQMLSRLFD